MSIVYDVLYQINNVFLILCTAAFGIQIVYVLLFFLKPKRYPDASRNHRFAVIIPARNEAEVIAETVKRLLAQNYPREMFDVFVLADNCTDDTAKVARLAGAVVFERNDADPEKARAGYAVRELIARVFGSDCGYEAFIRFDADNLMNDGYISAMNDAFDAGVKCARGFSNSRNIGDNLFASISGLWYIRECRYACRVRSAIGAAQMLTGAGMMFSAELIRENGWDCLTLSEDAEFAMNCLFDGVKPEYVDKAVVYEDQPSTLRDTFIRNTRMGHGLHGIFWTHGFRSLYLAVRRGSYSCLDMFLYLMFVPIAVVCCIWMPLYYGFDIVYSLIIGNAAHIYELGMLIGYILVFAFLIPFMLQAALAVILERRRIRVKKSKLILPILAFPLFMIIYAIAITVGVLTKPKWKKVARSKTARIHSADAANSAESV